MKNEIERKYLVNSDQWRGLAERSFDICQAYLANTTKSSIRVRLSDDRASINIKSTHSLMERVEYDYEIPYFEGQNLVRTLCEGEPLYKTRHIVRYKSHLWEIDEFSGRNAGLIIAEIELGKASEIFEKPSWVGAEVTDFKRFYNHQLVIRPYLSWLPKERDI